MYRDENMYQEGYEIVDGFVIKKVLGGGGQSCFGEVYAIQSKSTGDYLAIKTLQGEEFTKVDYFEFKNEMFPWILFFRHPYIVEAYGFELDKNKRPILLLELICSDDSKILTLTDFLNESLGEDQILKWSIQLCYAMDFINEKGYIHGDLKPDNILIKNGDVKITDFGLSEPLGSRKNNEKGPIEYRAPELCENDELCKSITTEIYAFGMLMYQMINGGELPTNVWWIDDWIEFHIKGEIPKIESDLFPIIEKCLEKSPKNRYQSFKELQGELSDVLRNKYSIEVEVPDFEISDLIGNVFRGRLYARLKDVKNCKKYYYKTLKHYPHNSFIFGYALDLIYLKEYDDALKFLKELEKDPVDLEIDSLYINIGRCYHGKNQLNNALIYYKKAIEQTDNLNAHLNVGNIYRKYGLFEMALKEFNYILEKDEANERALFHISKLYKLMGNSKEHDNHVKKLDYTLHNLETEFHLGLSVKDDNLLRFLSAMSTVENQYYFKNRVLYARCKFDLENDNQAEADKKFEEILDSCENLEIPLIFCDLYAKKGFEEEAIKKLDLIYPHANNILKNKIICQKSFIMENCDIDKSIELNKILLTKDINNEFKSNVYANLGDIYFQIGEKYAQCYIKSLKLNPKNIHSYKKLAAYYIENKKYDCAKKYLKEGLSIDCENWDLLYLKGIYYHCQDKISEAIVIYEKCLNFKPSEGLYNLLAICYKNLGEDLKAGLCLKCAMNISQI